MTDQESLTYTGSTNCRICNPPVTHNCRPTAPRNDNGHLIAATTAQPLKLRCAYVVIGTALADRL